MTFLKFKFEIYKDVIYYVSTKAVWSSTLLFNNALTGHQLWLQCLLVCCLCISSTTIACLWICPWLYVGCVYICRCVIAELFLDGQQLFDLSQLLDYRTKDYSPDPVLKKIADKHVRVGTSFPESHVVDLTTKKFLLMIFLCKLCSHAC